MVATHEGPGGSTHTWWLSEVARDGPVNFLESKHCSRDNARHVVFCIACLGREEKQVCKKGVNEVLGFPAD